MVIIGLLTAAWPMVLEGGWLWGIRTPTRIDYWIVPCVKMQFCWLVPTLTSGDTTEELANDEKLAPEIRQKFKDLGRPEFDAMKLAASAGVKVALGTAAAVMPHGWNLNELAHMANNGFTPEQALHAATRSAAELMGWEDRLGTLEQGKIADVVVVDGDPFAFDTLKDRIEQVWKDGARVV